MESAVSESVAWTQVTHNGTVYVVSTIRRSSSASLAPGRYYETIVTTPKAMKDTMRETPGGVRQHCEIVQRISEEGVEWLNEREDDQ